MQPLGLTPYTYSYTYTYTYTYSYSYSGQCRPNGLVYEYVYRFAEYVYGTLACVGLARQGRCRGHGKLDDGRQMARFTCRPGQAHARQAGAVLRNPFGVALGYAEGVVHHSPGVPRSGSPGRPAADGDTWHLAP